MTHNKKGFTLIELAVVMVIVGLLATGGIALVRALVASEQRAETATYLGETRQALLVYASRNGKLPSPDAALTAGGVKTGRTPTQTLQVPARDAWSRVLRYAVNEHLLVDKATSCVYLRNTLDISNPSPQIDAPKLLAQPPSGAAVAFAVPVVLVSAGAVDADLKNYEADPDSPAVYSVFDSVDGGDNNTGEPYYVRKRPNGSFDDIVTYIGVSTLYDWLKCP